MTQLLDILSKLYTIEGVTIWYEENVTLGELIERLELEEKAQHITIDNI